MNQRVESRNRDWQLAVRKVTDGPNSMTVYQFRYVPGDDGRFLHLFITLRNAGSQKRSWNWPRCGLDHGTDQLLPRLVMLDSVVNAPAEQTQELEAGEEISRRVIFTYPEDRLPTRLTCGELVVPLQLTGSR